MPCFDPRDDMVGPTARVSQADYDRVVAQRDTLQNKLHMIRDELNIRQGYAGQNTENKTLIRFLLWLIEQ